MFSGTLPSVAVRIIIIVPEHSVAYSPDYNAHGHVSTVWQKFISIWIAIDSGGESNLLIAVDMEGQHDTEIEDGLRAICC